MTDVPTKTKMSKAKSFASSPCAKMDALAKSVHARHNIDQVTSTNMTRP